MTTSVRFLVRLPPDLREQLERVQREQGRVSLNNMIIYALHEWLAGRGRRE
jgi:predicted HicB family RNase H-like nuclease